MAAPTLEAIRYRPGDLQVLNQLLLPHATSYDQIVTIEDAWHCIRDMRVRGAPAIAIVAALALAVQLRARTFASVPELQAFVTASWEHLKTSRPTAVNLFEAAKRFTDEVSALPADGSAEAGKAQLLAGLEAMLALDVADNMAIGRFGAEAILGPVPKPCRVLTHCNTGSLATAGYGTALGIIRALHAGGNLAHAYCTETRPYNQGARLTAYELVYERMPATLITDSMAAALMRTRGIEAVVVGADRVVANGDTANKIGTYQLAIVAAHHGVPFYVAAPLTSIDLTRATGAEITIEERAADELTTVQGQRVAAPGIGVWNPAFDVTPASLITGIVTEHGVITERCPAGLDVAAFVHRVRAGAKQ